MIGRLQLIFANDSAVEDGRTVVNMNLFRFKKPEIRLTPTASELDQTRTTVVSVYATELICAADGEFGADRGTVWVSLDSFCLSAAVFAFADSGGGRGIGRMHDVAAVEAIPTMPASRCGVPGLGSRGMAGMASAGHHNIICLHKLYVFNYISGVIVVGHVRCKVFIGLPGILGTKSRNIAGIGLTPTGGEPN